MNTDGCNTIVTNSNSNTQTIESSRLINLRDKIESFDKPQQLQILRILKNKKLNLNENKNGIFLNLTNLDNDIIKELENFIEHIDNQEIILQQNESVKQSYKETYFKDNKDILPDNTNVGEI
tara:strand:+ start:672 stop:1037 length:366 start_codon:yes stop_codon:yes gene_type:complete